jgi:hypothetical protein
MEANFELLHHLVMPIHLMTSHQNLSHSQYKQNSRISFSLLLPSNDHPSTNRPLLLKLAPAFRLSTPSLLQQGDALKTHTEQRPKKILQQ